MKAHALIQKQVPSFHSGPAPPGRPPPFPGHSSRGPSRIPTYSSLASSLCLWPKYPGPCQAPSPILTKLRLEGLGPRALGLLHPCAQVSSTPQFCQDRTLICLKACLPFQLLQSLFRMATPDLVQPQRSWPENPLTSPAENKRTLALPPSTTNARPRTPHTISVFLATWPWMITS